VTLAMMLDITWIVTITITQLGYLFLILCRGNLKEAKLLFTDEFEPHLILNGKKSLTTQTISTSDTI